MTDDKRELMSTAEQDANGTDEKAQQIAEAMDMTAAELDAKLYKAAAKAYAAEAADGDAEQAVEENRSSTINSIHEQIVSEVAAGLVSEDGVTLTGEADESGEARDEADAYGSGIQNERSNPGESPLDADDPDNYGTGTEY